MKKKILFVILIILVLLLISILLFVNLYKKDYINNKQEEKVVDLEEVYKDYKDITTDQIKEEKKFKQLKFTNGQLKVKDGKGIFKVIIINETEEDIELGKFKVILKDKDKNIVIAFNAYAGDVVKAGHSVSPYIPIKVNVNEVCTVEYE